MASCPQQTRRESMQPITGVEVRDRNRSKGKMYMWCFSIALTFGLLWCFSDGGRTLIQLFFCFLCWCCSTPLFDIKREQSTQTDKETKENETSFQETVDEDLVVDATDGESRKEAQPLECQYPHVKKSLQQVFECAYTQLILPWYSVPEPREHQPLHQVLSKEFDFVVNRIFERSRDFDICQVVVGSIQILTQYLRNAKQPDRQLLFSSRADEIAVLREFSDALLRNLFSISLGEQKVNHCVLNEIFAVKGLGLLVTWLSDPDNLNQLVVSQLDSVTSEVSVEDLHDLDHEQTSLASQEGKGYESDGNFQEAGILASTRIKGKSRGQKFRDGLSRFMDKMKPKGAKKKKERIREQDPMMRSMVTQADTSIEDDVSSRESSIYSQQDSDREDSDLESYLSNQENMMEFKLSCEMWRVGHWVVAIPRADMEDKDLIFTVHLEENNSPENLQWEIRKSYIDVIHFRNKWQDSTNLPTILELDDSEVNDEVKEQVRLSVQHFLQELVSDNVIGNTEPVFQFFCPLDKLLNEEEDQGGVWELLSGLAYFLTPGQDEEENSSPQTEAPKEIIMPSPQPALPSESSDASTQKSNDVTGASLPAIVISHCDPPPELHKDAETEKEPQPAVNSDSSSTESCCQDKMEDSDNSSTSHFKMIKRVSLSKSQESLVSTKASNEDLLASDLALHCSQNEGLQGESTESPSLFNLSTRENKKEKIGFRRLGGAIKPKVKEQSDNKARGEDTQCQKGQGNMEQLEATKAIFDLLKEISGNSILLNIIDTILKPFMPVVKKKVNSFLNKMNSTEEQMAVYIKTLRHKLWPEIQSAAPSPPPRSDEEKNETRERAHNLINSRCLKYHILKKSDMDCVFNLFQKSEENKTLVYMLLSFLLRECFPDDHSLNARAGAIQKITKSTY